MCERCGAEVTKRELTQWYFKVTDYAQRLLDDMEPLADDLAGPGAGHAAQLDRPLRGRARRLRGRRAAYDGEPIRCSPRGPDTLFGATFMVVAADAKIAADELAPTSGARPWRTTWSRSARPPTSTGWPPTGPKTGVDLGVTAVNPVTGDADPGLGRPTTCWPTTAPARSWRCPARTSGTGSSPRSSACRSCAPCSRPRASRRRREAFTGDGPGDQLRQRRDLPGRPAGRRGEGAGSSPGWRRRAPAPAR